MRTLLSTVLLAAAALAQSQTFTIPGPAVPTANTNVPISAGIGRYQQWYSAADVRGALGSPMRFERLSLLAGAGQTAIATTIDCEVSIGHGFGFGITGAFDSNFASPKTIVFPRGNLALSPGTSGQAVLNVNFATLFTWDGVSPLVVEFRVFGNGRGNTSFNYDFRGTSLGIGHVTRVYQGGNASATNGVAQQGQGLFTTFTARPGVTIAFGNGCPGPNFVYPIASVSGIPEPGTTWTHQVLSASPQRLAMLVMGDSNTTWGPTALPLDLTPFVGAGGCFLLVSPIVTFFTTTIGGPGAGIGTVPIAMPPVTSYVGTSLFTQWFVSDPSAVNFVMSGTGGIWSIVKPVGG